jgi:aryl-alcohol dehydrogenase-like predicted oxidoreductase
VKGLLDAAVFSASRSKQVAQEAQARTVAPITPPVTPYKCADIEQSVHRSLRKLGVEAIDVFLLHDCVPGNVSEDVVVCLQKLVEDGKILSYGLATGKTASARILTSSPRFRGLVQVPLTAMDNGLSQIQVANNLLTVTHSAINHIAPRLQGYLEFGENRRRWSDAIGVDLYSPGSIAKLLLAHARQSNSNGIVLFSSRKPNNICSNAKALFDPNLTAEQLRTFVDLIRRELAPQ